MFAIVRAWCVQFFIETCFAIRLNLKRSPEIPKCAAEVASRLGVPESKVEDSSLSGGFSKLFQVSVDEHAVLAKTLPVEAESDEFVNELFSREQRFYHYAGPAIHAGQAINESLSLRIPQILHSSHGIIAMEDLRQALYKPCSSEKLLSVAEMTRIVGALAEFHALPLIGSEQSRFPIHRFPPRSDWEGFGEGVTPMVVAGIQRLKDEDFVTPQIVKSLERAEIVDTLTASVEGPSVLCHGDCWMENWLLHPKGFVATIDFQFVGQGLAADDLVLLLFTGMESSARRKYWDHLLHVYASRYNEIEKTRGKAPTDFSDMFTKANLRHGAALTALVLLADLDKFPKDHTVAILQDVSAMLT
mmetsp:Transcript_3754/g.6054  ORF Transcript_3754/g.6054 Transcript_3754/m.6054 type:complete len:359 (-) Transcript_3754:60-1136(-)